jgi:hypothetical protein
MSKKGKKVLQRKKHRDTWTGTEKGRKKNIRVLTKKERLNIRAYKVREKN